MPSALRAARTTTDREIDAAIDQLSAAVTARCIDLQDIVA
jgi:hypothetical protein